MRIGQCAYFIMLSVWMTSHVYAEPILYDTYVFGENQGLSISIGTLSGVTNQPALGFISPSSVRLDSIRFRATIFSGTAAFTVRFWDDEGGFPGTILEEWIVSVPQSSFGDVLISSSNQAPLVMGNTYWVSLAGGDETTFGGWRRANTSLTNGAVAASNEADAEFFLTPLIPGMVTVMGVPEPTTIAILAFAVAALTQRRRRGWQRHRVRGAHKPKQILKSLMKAKPNDPRASRYLRQLLGE